MMMDCLELEGGEVLGLLVLAQQVQEGLGMAAVSTLQWVKVGHHLLQKCITQYLVRYNESYHQILLIIQMCEVVKEILIRCVCHIENIEISTVEQVEVNTTNGLMSL
jgi:hypothetical protein